MRQLFVDLKAEYADFTDGEIAAICAIQFAGRRPSHHTVKAVLARLCTILLTNKQREQAEQE
jgi:hypothetical protein